MAKAYPKLNWLSDVAEDNYPAAHDYVALRWAPDRAAKAVEALRAAAPIAGFQPSDILRAAQQPVLGLDNPGVMRELRNMITTGAISPILLVNLPEFVVIADGYHRTCLAYHLAPFRRVPCRMITYVDPSGPIARWQLLNDAQEHAELTPESVGEPLAESWGDGEMTDEAIQGADKATARAARAAVGASTGVNLWESTPWWDEPEPDDWIGDED